MSAGTDYIPYLILFCILGFALILNTASNGNVYISNFILISILGFVIGVVIFYTGLSALFLKRLIENIPTSKVGSAALGLVEVCGIVVPCGKCLTSPFTEKDCVCYACTVEEWAGNKWDKVISEESRTRFYLKDDTGSLLVDPKKGRIDVPASYDICSGSSKDPPRSVLEFLKRNGLKHDDFLGGNKNMRFREHCIAPGETLYIMGTAKTDSETSPATHMINACQNEKTFIISNSPEKKILKRLNRSFYLRIFGGASLSVICLGVILMYFRIL
jgi:hypothetical protein